MACILVLRSYIQNYVMLHNTTDDVCTATTTTSGMYNLVGFAWFLGKYTPPGSYICSNSQYGQYLLVNIA